MTGFFSGAGGSCKGRSGLDRVWSGRAARHPILATAAAAFLLSVAADAASAACNQTITIAQTQPLSYGNIAPASGGGTVTVSSAGIASAPFGFALSGGSAAGQFRVTGSNNCVVSISFVAGSLIGPGPAMQIRNFTTDAGASPTLHPPGGLLDFDVGGDLVVNANQPGGTYIGSYTVTVIY
jgi:Domain of unknown function (DUF4402)